MNLWKKISFSVLIIIILLCTATIFLGWTTIGLQLICNLVTSYWIPELKIDQITGSWHNLYMKNVFYKHSGITVHVKELYLVIKLSSLYKRNIYIDNLSLNDVYTAIDLKKILQSGQIKKKDGIFKNLFTSYPITFNHIILKNFNLNIDNTIISVKKFSSNLHLWKKNLTLTSTSLNELLILVSKNSNITKNKAINSKIYSQQLKKKLIDNISKSTYLKVFLQKIVNVQIPFNLNIKDFKGKNLRLINNIDLMIYDFLLEMNCTNNFIELKTLEINSNQGIFNITGSSELNGNWPILIMLNGTLNTNSLSNEKIKLKISGMLLSKLEIEAILLEPVHITICAQAYLTKAGIPINLKIISNKNFYYLFSNKKQLQVDKIELEFNGKITNYTIFFHTLIRGKKIPFINVTLNAKGNERQLYIDKSTISLLNSKIQFIALFNWHQYPNINWHSRVNLKDSNIIKKVLNCPLKLDGLIKVNGNLCDSNWQIEIQKLKIIGKINKNKFLIDGSLKGNNHLQWIIPNLNLILGHNNINLKGNLDVKKIDFNTTVNITNLNDISPKISGTIKGIIKLRGAINNLQLLTNILISNLHWKKLAIKYIQIDNYAEYTNQINGYLNLNIEHITHHNINTESIILKIRGNKQQHILQLCINNKEFISGKIHLVGNLNRQERNWKWTIGNMYFTIFSLQPWVISKSTSLDYYNLEQNVNTTLRYQNNLNTETYALQDNHAKINIHEIINFNLFNIDTLKSLSPKISLKNNIVYNKITNIIYSIFKKRLLQGSIIFSGCNLKIIQKLDDIPLIINFDALDFYIKSYDDFIELKWLIRLTNKSQFDGQIYFSNLQKYFDLYGNINIYNFNLTTVNIFFPFRERVNGILNANLKLVNGIKGIQLFGKVQFNNISINRNLAFLDIEGNLLTIHFNGTYSTFSGLVNTKQGTIYLNGSLNWNTSDEWNIHILIKGSRIRIAISPILQFDISPDLAIKITSNIFSISGLVDVPWARISVNKLPKNIIPVSNDEIILNEKLKSTKIKIFSAKFVSKLTVHIGNDVYMNAFGLEARLAGNLKITHNKQKINFNGQINIQDGHFYTYGYDMIIRSGRLLFSGPLDHTTLDIEAIRNPKSTEKNIIVGIRIAISSINEQKIEIFSIPEMSQREVLSYLLNGCGTNINQNNTYSTIISIFSNLCIIQSNQIINKIGEIFGIKNLIINTQVVDKSSKVIIKGYILPNLQIEYGIRVSNSIGSFTLRYNLTPKLRLEIMSNVNQTIKLIYQFSF